MRLHREREKHEALPPEEDNSWGKYLLRSNGVCRISLGLALTLDETLVQGRMGKRYAKSSGVSETPTTKVIPPRDGRFLMAPLSPLRPFDRLPRFTSPLNTVSLSSAQLSIQSEPDNLPERILTQAHYYLGTPFSGAVPIRAGSGLERGRSISPTDELLDITF